MITTIILVIIFCIGIGLCIYGGHSTIDKQKEIKDLQNQQTQLRKDNDILSDNKKTLLYQIEEKEKQLNKTAEYINNNKQTINDAMTSYFKIIENQYQQKEIEYNNLVDKLDKDYNERQDRISAAIDQCKQDLDKIRQSYAAAIEAQLREMKLQEDNSTYRMVLSDDDIDDINILERIKPKLNQPRVLCKLIWSTYYQQQMNQLCSRVLGLSTVTGIYKITNQETGQCYVGQGVDVAGRWKDHAKYGLGIDTPQNNKLYKAMAEFGLYNFTFELLEQCPREQLNEKEKFYIELYQSTKVGYNTQKGVSKV